MFSGSLDVRATAGRACWSLPVLQAGQGQCSWPLLALCMCACTAVRALGRAWATRWVISKSRDAWGYFCAGSRLLVPPGHCLRSATWPYPGHPVAAVCNSPSAPLPPPSRCRRTQKTHRPDVTTIKGEGDLTREGARGGPRQHWTRASTSKKSVVEVAPSLPGRLQGGLGKHWQASHPRVAPVPCRDNNYCRRFIHVVLLLLACLLLQALESIGARGLRIWALSKTG